MTLQYLAHKKPWLVSAFNKLACDGPFLPSKGVTSPFHNDAGPYTWHISLLHTLFALGREGGGVLIRSTQDALQDLLTHAQTKH
jgi:hypothetical protein